MKKLGLLLIVLFFVGCMTSCILPKSDKQYIKFCKTDTLIIGFQYTFLYNDSADITLQVYNSVFESWLIPDRNRMYANNNSFFSDEGYWNFIRSLNDKGIPITPKDIKIIRVPRQPDFRHFINWRYE